MPSEAQFLHRALFRISPLPEEVDARYESARKRFFAADGWDRLVCRLMEEGLDPEAVEFALRLSRGPNGLTRRFQVMLMLCEVRSAYDARFLSLSDRRIRAWATAPAMALRAAWKLAKGLYLCRVHHLADLVDV